MVQCLRFCRHKGLNNILIETDSLGLLKIVSGVWKVSWALSEKIAEIRAKHE